MVQSLPMSWRISLKSKGLYDGVQSRITISNTLDRIKRKMKIGGVDFTANACFYCGAVRW